MRWELEFEGVTIPVVADDLEGLPVVILAHGAGSHMEQKTVLWLAKILRSSGFRVVRFNFKYRACGKSMPDRMPTLIATYREVIRSVRERINPTQLFIGGHSMGGRAASMLEAEGREADGLLLFGYPLHPSGQPEKLRDLHLAKIGTPTLQVNGNEDPLCTPELMEITAAKLDPEIWTLHWVTGADHSYAVRKSSGRSGPEVAGEIESMVTNWLTHLAD